MHRVLLVVVGLLTAFAFLASTAVAAPAEQAQNCQFVLGFATLHNLIPNVVGNCLSNEQHAANGDGLQPTTKGLMVWRKADNFTAFTDGFRTWVNGPFGVQERLNTQRFDFEKQATVPSTQVVRFVPPTTAARQAPGSCFTSSLAATRSDAFRCTSDNEILDPCFTIPGNTSAMLCVRNPLDSSTFVQLNLTQPLPAPEPVPAQTHPWFLQLADNTVCGFFTGATGAVNGERINYGCTDNLDVVGLPKQDTVWTVEEVRLAPTSFTPVKTFTVQVKTAWE
jgi:hypothetical protein